MRTKYIVGQTRTGFIVAVVAVIFPEGMSHSDVARDIFGERFNLLGSGFCSVGIEGVEVYGDSVSLGLKSREADVLYLNHTLGFLQAVPYEIRKADQEQVQQQYRASIVPVMRVG